MINNMNEDKHVALNDFEETKNILDSVGETKKVVNSDDDFKGANKQQLRNRDEVFTKLLKDFYEIFVERQIKKEHYKWQFYKITTRGMIVVVLLLMAALFILVIKVDSENLSDFVPTLITALVSIITTVIAIPTIISKYLFDPKEDTEMIGMIKSIQEKDLERYDKL